MADARRPDTLLIDSALATGSPHVRAVAALTVGQAGVTERGPRLRALLADSDTAVAANAAFALGLLRDSLAVADLARALDGPAPVAVEAAWALGEIGAPARDTIVLRLRSIPRGVPWHGEILKAAAKLRPVPVSDIASWLDGWASHVPNPAAYALGRSAPPAAVRPLLGLVNGPASIARDPDAHETLASVARGLAAPAAGDSLGVAAREALNGLVRHPHPHVRINAIRALGTHGPAARDVVIAATQDEDANVRITAAQTAGSVLDSAPGSWRLLWAADTGFAYRASLLASAGRGRPVAVVLDLAESWRSHDEWRFRAARAAALAAASRSRLRDSALREPASDSDSRVRLATVAAYADSAAPAEVRIDLLGIASRDGDAFVRAAALGALAPRASAAQLPIVLAAYRRAQSDTVNDARLAAIALIASTWRRDSLTIPAALVAELRALPAPADPLERLAGRTVSVLSHWPGAEGTPRPLAWYEERIRSFVLPALSGRPPVAVFDTRRGPITIELAGADAPLTVDNFVTLVRAGYYRGARFHRVVPNFVAQDGDPRGDGNGGPGYAIRDELNRRRYARGAVGMALSGPDTGGSQYFFTLSPQPHLDGHYTVFARVIDGWDALDAIVQGDEIRGVTIR